jgi:hypothetical protein
MPKRHDVGAYFRRHNRLLTYLGAFIVFATFVVREGIREHLKELTDSIDVAQNVFVVRVDNIETNYALGGLRRQMAAIKDAPSAGKAREDLFDAAARELEVSKNRFREVASYLDCISRLIARLPSQTTPVTLKNTWLLKTMSGTPNGLLQAFRVQLKQSWESENKVRQLMKLDHSGDQDASSAAGKLAGDSVLLYLDSQTFGWLILGEAMKARERSEHFYDISKKVSYLLYVLGWGLGLFGRLYRVPGLSAGE